MVVMAGLIVPRLAGIGNVIKQQRLQEEKKAQEMAKRRGGRRMGMLRLLIARKRRSRMEGRRKSQ